MPMPNKILREVRRFIESARPDGDSDRALIEKFAATRDERAFAELVRRHGPMVLGVCRRVLRHATDAEDAFQATFLILVRKAKSISDPDRLGSWLYGVAWRTANKLRIARRSVATLPDDLAERKSTADWPIELDSAIACLPEKYRTPIILCHLQGLSPAEVAGRIGCAPATIATRLFRARETLRRRLTALGLAIPAAMIAGSSLQVPSALASAVSEMAAGRITSPAAARLADGVFRSLLMTKIRWAATAATVCLAGVGVLGFRAGGQERGKTDEPPRVITPTVQLREPPAQPSLLVYDQSPQSTVTTANFRVHAPSARVARIVANAAEHARQDIAIAWLGKELPAWSQPCPVRVTIREGSSGGTSFNFDGGKMLSRRCWKSRHC
jgi:RNA polymerase sigma factor (sigma-70 family)